MRMCKMNEQVRKIKQMQEYRRCKCCGKKLRPSELQYVAVPFSDGKFKMMVCKYGTGCREIKSNKIILK